MHKILFIFVSLIIPNLLIASSTKTSASDRFISRFEQDWFLAFSYGVSNAKVKHTDESSTLSGFSSLSAENSVSIKFYTLSATKEFFKQNRFSLSATGLAGILDGGGDGIAAGTSFEEEASGGQFGLALSANLNYSAYAMKVQPYFGFGLIQEISTYQSEYSLSGNRIQTEYKYSGTLADIGIGIRFLDPKVSLMSFFNLSYISSLSEDISATAKIDEIEGNISNSSVTQGAIKASLGFGFLF